MDSHWLLGPLCKQAAQAGNLCNPRALLPSPAQGVLNDVDLLQRITEACRVCVREFVRDRTGLDGRIGTNYLTSIMKFTGFYVDPWVRGVQGTEFASANREELIETFK